MKKFLLWKNLIALVFFFLILPPDNTKAQINNGFKPNFTADNGGESDGLPGLTHGIISTTAFLYAAVPNNLAVVINCPVAVTVSCANEVPDHATNYAAFVAAGGSASSDCPGAIFIIWVSDGITPGDCLNHYTITRVYQAMDECNNINTCSQIITVNDNIAPEITCPAALELICADEVPPHATDYTSFVIAGGSATDNCGGPVTLTWLQDLISGYTCVNHFTITRFYKATDICGNADFCAQTITVDDRIPPTITCPASISVLSPGAVPPASPGSITATDNCTGPVIVTFEGDIVSDYTCETRYTITRTYKAMDVCGNSSTCSQTIRVNDNTPPVINCPPSPSVQCAGQIPPPLTDFASFVQAGGTVTSVCEGTTITVTWEGDITVSGDCANHFVVLRKYKATDGSGNFDFCTQMIIVNDNTAPEISCPPSMEVKCADDVPPHATGYASFMEAGGSATDNCTGPVIVTWVSDLITNGTCAHRYRITRRYKATDNCGNFDFCEQTIDVNDDVPPTITSCPAPYDIEGCSTAAITGLIYSPTPVQVTATQFASAGGAATDNCSGITSYSYMDAANNGCPIIVTRTWTVTDACGTSASCTQSITIQNNTAVVFTCAADKSAKSKR